jgi:transposase
MATIRYKNRYNKWYAYEVIQYWDKKLKKPRQRTKYLGVADKKGAPYTKPSKRVQVRVEKAILDFGDSYAISEVSRAMGLSSLIENSFGNLDSITTLICFQITEGLAMYNCDSWLEGNIAKKIFPNSKVSSQRISTLVKTLGDQNLQIAFFKNYIDKFFPSSRGILIDSTALPSAINSAINTFGYSSGKIERNVTCLMLVDKKSKLPIYFRALGGDIADISTLQTTVTELKRLGLKTDSAILDAGFCSKETLQFMCLEQINFITRLPKSHKVFGDLIEQAGQIEASANAVKYGDRIVFIKSKKTNLYGHEIYIHVILDPSKKSKDTHLILKNRLDDEISKEDEKELDEKMKNAGFFILLSRERIEAAEILPNYYTRQSIEQMFSFAKSNTKMLPLRVHSDQSIKGYLMLIFLALIVFVYMNQKLKMPMDKALLILRQLKAKVFDNEIIIQEANKKTKEIFKALNVIMPTKMGI